MDPVTAYDPATLPAGVRSRFEPGINGLRMHVLEAGFEQAGRPCLLLLHGFPELAYAWRKVMPALAAAGFHVVAPDLRGYGRTTGCDTSYDGDLRAFRTLNRVKDILCLVEALGEHSVHSIIGHDFGSIVAAWCALIRPDVFRSVSLMCAPFGGAPALPGHALRDPDTIHADLAALDPPRKHYHWYYSTRGANENMMSAPQGIHAFLRAYNHYKSGDWPGNEPVPLRAWLADELAKMPTYYIMPLNAGMAETVAPFMPTPAQVESCRWLPDEELAVYSGEFARTGFQGGLQWYRCETSGMNDDDLQVFSGRSIDVPCCFIAGARDWGVRQRPGLFEAMQSSACTNLVGCQLVERAGHWVQQESPDEVVSLLLEFLK